MKIDTWIFFSVKGGFFKTLSIPYLDILLKSFILGMMWMQKRWFLNRIRRRKKTELLCFDFTLLSISSLGVIRQVYRVTVSIYSHAIYSIQPQNVPLWSLHSSQTSTVPWQRHHPPTSVAQRRPNWGCGQTGCEGGGGLEKSNFLKVGELGQAWSWELLGVHSVTVSFCWAPIMCQTL